MLNIESLCAPCWVVIAVCVCSVRSPLPLPPSVRLSAAAAVGCSGTTKEQEVKRVDKELAHIRKQFGDKCTTPTQTRVQMDGRRGRQRQGSVADFSVRLAVLVPSVLLCAPLFHRPAAIDGYNMRKYTWKLLYMYMLGYDIEMSVGAAGTNAQPPTTTLRPRAARSRAQRISPCLAV